MCLMPLNCTHCQGIMAPGQRRLKISHKFKNNMEYILPYNVKKETKGDANLIWLESWNCMANMCTSYLSQPNTAEKQ